MEVSAFCTTYRGCLIHVRFVNGARWNHRSEFARPSTGGRIQRDGKGSSHRRAAGGCRTDLNGRAFDQLEIAA